MWALLLLSAVATLSQAQTDCSRGACYPPSQDLLVGRSHQLHASSTCGLTGSEVYCTLYRQGSMKCCPCDSRDPNGPLAHTVQEVLSNAGPGRWWQSKKELNPVSLQLDLNSLFQLDNLVLRFKGPRPSALIIERSLDNGTTWKPALYLATDCQSSFPDVSTTTPLTTDKTYCHALPPTGLDPYKDHTIEFSPLRQYTYVSAPNSQKIEDVSGLTGLRVQLVKLGNPPHLPGRTLSRFYALKEMSVMGSCMCHGHANRCLQDTSDRQPSVQVYPQCDCQHNTAGVNCERCDDLYNDLPWKPAEEGHTHACKRCECNNHAERCHFDQAVYEASGRKSGGVCDSCQHFTTGPKCDQCAAGYQPNPWSRMDRPDACIRCPCSAEGSVNGKCEDSTGSCQCKVNVEGRHCDRCKRGFYGLSESNPQGCTKCSCSPDGSLSDVCDQLTGQCRCRSHFHGQNCEVCSNGYWKPSGSSQCKPCGCDSTRSYSDTCDQVTGQCRCRPGFGGLTCTECPENTYGDPDVGCKSCRCDREGTLAEVCDKQTGACLCRPGVTGTRCDSCRRGHCDLFPVCEKCPSCFFTLDQQRENISLALGILTSNLLPSRPSDFGPKILSLEIKARRIQNFINLPPSISQQIEEALSTLHELGDHVERVDDSLSPFTYTNFGKDVDKLQSLLDSLTKFYNVQVDTKTNITDPSVVGGFSEIKNNYDRSTNASKTVDESDDTVKSSAENRQDVNNLTNKFQPANTEDLNRLNQHIGTQPDLTPVAKKICASDRTEPCTPLKCDGTDLCRYCRRGEKCDGAVPLSNKAEADSRNVKDQLDRLNKKIIEAEEKLQEAQETTNQVRVSTEKLSNKTKKTRDKIEQELKNAEDIKKQFIDFLSDPSLNLSKIQSVSDKILKINLPLTLAPLKTKLEEMKNLAASLPDSRAVLKEAESQLEAARNMLKEAEAARDTAIGVKADVDGLLSGFSSTENSLSDLEDRLQNSMDLIDNLKVNLTQVRDKLTPAEKALEDASTLVKPMKPQLEKVKDLLLNAEQQAEDALETAANATDEADAANEDLLSLEDLLDRLKDKPSTGGDMGLVGERLAKLQQDAGALANTTANMMDAINGKADSLRQLQDQIIHKSKGLEGLDNKLKDILSKLQKKGMDLSTCRG
ncbi:laminin subunit beta-3 [Cynoglossus semilaevis]|uniref:Laminin subunit beta-3 n=1 Tax=Cynoglossus semilaevis TaxID=244447 RepID=A0A3P8WRQ3_CYNSE|nr:laminin subunit beta-3 [Cynoglossus semilaevis]XP_008319202.1 laminin subunit beta-3 [Cynoglossus semilaevis]XP_024916060.1 laminin subunit beta-3 [Cynoglossus semilaevis]